MSIHLFAVEPFALKSRLAEPVSDFLRWLYHETDQSLCELVEQQLSTHCGVDIDELERAQTPLSQLLSLYPELAVPVLRALSVRSFVDEQPDYLGYTIEQLTGRDLTVDRLEDLLLDEDFWDEVIDLVDQLELNPTPTSELLDWESLRLLADVYATAVANQLRLVLVKGIQIHNLSF
ncbi:MAG: hypothetical protein KC609_00365 [Myxococcales bacterium]|nr:hypothetical protein [Myxococcales bacterium]